MRNNNHLPNVHLRKHWQKWVRTWFTQPARKKRRQQKRREKAEKLFPRPVEKLRPVVRDQTIRYNRKVRLGRGFTLQELKAVKITRDFARSIGIAVDHRRTNKSEESLKRNVMRLQAYLTKLIIYPRNKDKLKKGPIPDTSADPTKANQTLDKKLMGFYPEDKKMRHPHKPMEITKEMREKKIFRLIKKEKNDAKYRGIRELRKKEEAEKNA